MIKVKIPIQFNNVSSAFLMKEIDTITCITWQNGMYMNKTIPKVCNWNALPRHKSRQHILTEMNDKEHPLQCTSTTTKHTQTSKKTVKLANTLNASTYKNKNQLTRKTIATDMFHVLHYPGQRIICVVSLPPFLADLIDLMNNLKR